MPSNDSGDKDGEESAYNVPTLTEITAGLKTKKVFNCAENQETNMHKLTNAKFEIYEIVNLNKKQSQIIDFFK